MRGHRGAGSSRRTWLLRVVDGRLPNRNRRCKFWSEHVAREIAAAHQLLVQKFVVGIGTFTNAAERDRRDGRSARSSSSTDIQSFGKERTTNAPCATTARRARRRRWTASFFDEASCRHCGNAGRKTSPQSATRRVLAQTSAGTSEWEIDVTWKPLSPPCCIVTRDEEDDTPDRARATQAMLRLLGRHGKLTERNSFHLAVLYQGRLVVADGSWYPSR